MFPSTIDTITVMSGSSTLGAAGHSTRHNNEIKPIVEALEAKVGINSSADTTSLDYKLSGIPTNDKAISSTGYETLTNKDLTSGTNTFPSLGVTLTQIYPVGSVYINAAVATNPATLFGFGTWVAIGSGQVLVGVNTGDSNFNTLAKTGGADSINLSHSHTVYGHTHDLAGHVHGHTHNHGINQDGSFAYSPGSGSTPNASRQYHDHGGAVIANTAQPNTDGPNTNSSGSSAPGMEAELSSTQSVLQPYITVYMWKRTV